MRATEAKRQVPYVNLGHQFQGEREGLVAVVESVLARGEYVGGEEVERLERDLAGYCGVKHVVALNSGTDALELGLLALGVGPGDEVITPPNSFVASTAAVVHVGAKPVFVDVRPDQNLDPDKITEALTPRTKAIMPVHLTGRIADMDPIRAIADRHGLKIIEDAAQAIGSEYRGRRSGALGHAGAFSAHPLKNLNACGDAGFLTTDDDHVARRVRLLRNHGLVDRNTVEEFGRVSRMDTLHAAMLRFRLGYLPGIIEARRRNAAQYRELLADLPVFVAPDRDVEYNTYHTFVIQVEARDELRAYLAKQGVGTAIHYPIPIHLQPAAAALGHRRGDFPVTELQATRILTLPVNQSLSQDDVTYVAEQVRAFFSRH